MLVYGTIVHLVLAADYVWTMLWVWLELLASERQLRVSLSPALLAGPIFGWGKISLVNGVIVDLAFR